MKFQTRRISILIAMSAILLAAINIVTATPDPCAPTLGRVNAMGACPVPTPDPCAPALSNVSALMACPVPTPDPIEAVPTVEPAKMDENVSFNDSDLGVSLFKSEDASGNMQMDIYKVLTGSTASTYLFSVTQDEIAPYMQNHPANNTLLVSGEGVSVYVLTTGEIQINAGPDAEGKTHVKIFDGIPWTKVYGYTIDPE